MSYKLATIDKNAPLDFLPEDNLLTEPDNDKLYALFQRLEFSKLIDKFALKPPETPVPEQKSSDLTWRIQPDLTDLLSVLSSAPKVFFVITKALDGLCLIVGSDGYLIEKCATHPLIMRNS
jgi:hypothetical protein